eukprot:TRINITY_DN123877_c0_g1_i1.p1 TRINITY_DN123877_c0_g1~~TRINITY_DN123877_c0_g1_i1.p1  ORF type:complete len:365 (-),score=55.14 TRINITY_DN123877_c0_g1_i1:202-1296(-)
MGCGVTSSRGALGASSSSFVEAANLRQNGGPQGRNGGQRPGDQEAALGSRVRVADAGEEGSAVGGFRRISRGRRESGDSPGVSGDEGRRSRSGGGGGGGQEGGGGGPGQRTPVGRRFIVGDRVVYTSRLPGNPQDHAFCFECGAFFQLPENRSALCPRCNGNFVQFVQSAGTENWITAESAAGQDYSFDDRLDDSITRSMDEAPILKRPTQKAFLRSLPAVWLSARDLEERALFKEADPRRHCAICRDGFDAESSLRKLPCGHEFHGGCIVPWLQGQSTCPICRHKMPEASAEGEEDEDGEAEQVKSRSPQGPAATDAHSGSEEGVRSPMAAARLNREEDQPVLEADDEASSPTLGRPDHVGAD